MAGIVLISKDGEPLKYADDETGAVVKVRSLIDSETGKKVCMVFDGDIMRVVQIHGDSFKKKLWKRELKIDEDAVDVGSLFKHCDATEKTRIRNLTTAVSGM